MCKAPTQNTPIFSLMNTSTGIEPNGFILRLFNVTYFRQLVVGRRRPYGPPLSATQFCVLYSYDVTNHKYFLV
jgi:hypothetical protein